MARVRQQHSAGKIFENILFLAEVFGDRPDEDIPPLPVLEMAQCFELREIDDDARFGLGQPASE